MAEKKQFHLELFKSLKDDLELMKKKKNFTTLTAFINHILTEYVENNK